jgi:hypothetical protein
MTRQGSNNDKDNERQAFARRLAEALTQSGRTLSPTRLAAEFNAFFRGPKVHMHSCRKWLHAESIPTQEKLVVLARMLGVSADWLRYGGTGQMAAEPDPGRYVGNAQELSLLAAIQQLTERDKRLVQGLIQAMLSRR